MEGLSAYLAIGIYIAAGTTIAWFAKKRLRKDVKDFYTAGGRFGSLVVSLSYAATTYSAFMFIGLVGLSYQSGVGAMGFELVYFVGTLFLLYYLAPKYYSLHSRYGYISPAEVLTDRYGSPAVGMVVTLISLVALIPYSSAQIMGIAFAAEGASGGAIPFTLAVIIAVSLALLWSVVAGVWSVGWTDVYQGILMIVAGVAVLAWAISWALSLPSFSFMSGELGYVPNSYWSPQTFLNMTIPWFFFAITNPQVVQRLFAPKSREAQKNMITLFGAYGLIFTVMVCVLGLVLKGATIAGGFPLVTYRDAVTPTLLGILPPWLTIFGLVAIIAASISTIDSIILTLSSMSIRDVFLPLRPKLSQKAQISVGRAVMIVLALGCMVFSLSRPGLIVDLSVLSSSLLLPIAPLVLGSFLWGRGGKRSALASLVAGFATATALYYLKLSPLGLPMNLWTLAASSLIYVTFGSFEKIPEAGKKVRES
ncbi:MAG: sodium:solute symporter family protein [Candidatus Methanosuratincola sp.]|jgi:SSS family solute:Na+ symporter|nr:sodium:solute symporter family protein [Candidatus Methanosuratincola sp.]